MTSNRITRVNELVKREIAASIYRIVDASEVDLATLTINRVETSPNLRKARVYVSVRGTPDAQQNALKTLRRHRAEFQETLGHHVVLKYTPQLHFTLDSSVAEGDRVLEILSQIGPLTAEDDDDEEEEEEEEEDRQ